MLVPFARDGATMDTAHLKLAQLTDLKEEQSFILGGILQLGDENKALRRSSGSIRVRIVESFFYTRV